MRRFWLLLAFCAALFGVQPPAHAQLAPQLAPQTAMQHALRAFDALRAGDWQLAQFYATHALDAGTLARGDQAGVLSYRGDARRRLNDFQGAIDDYSQAIALGLPAQFLARVYNNRALAHIRTDRADLAFQDYTRAIELDPTFAEALNNRGAIYTMNGRYDLALADHTAAIRLNPNNARAFSNRGQAYLRLKFYEEAIDDFTRAMDMATAVDDGVTALFNRGLAYEGLGEEPEAKADFELAHQFAPDEPTYMEKYVQYGIVRP